MFIQNIAYNFVCICVAVVEFWATSASGPSTHDNPGHPSPLPGVGFFVGFLPPEAGLRRGPCQEVCWWPWPLLPPDQVAIYVGQAGLPSPGCRWPPSSSPGLLAATACDGLCWQARVGPTCSVCWSPHPPPGGFLSGLCGHI
jgi:hypothetical protein